VIVSVTALGSRDGDAAAAVARVVDYLDGRCPQPPGRSPQWWQDNGLEAKAPFDHGLGPASNGAVSYYADSVEGPGTWMGRGLAGFSPAGEVSRAQLGRMLFGQEPRSGRQLLDGRGSAARADHLGRGGATVAAHGPDDELLSIPQAASLLGVSPQYLRTVVARTQAARSQGEGPERQGTPCPLEHPYLDATRAGPNGHWSVIRAEVKRFAQARRAPTAVIGYDLTFSVPKSVSLLWARADGARQGAITAAVHEAVAAGMAYLEDNAAFVRTGARAKAQPAKGLLAASYLHGTSRALDPQLHAHVVVANMAEGPDGVVRALDGRALFAHAKTASYLAAAELRLGLTRRLGVEWEPAERGLADIAGVPRPAIVEMSKRSRQLEAVLPELEAFYSGGNGLRARGRQVAAYVTRAAKEDHGVDPEALRPWWASQLDAVGFDLAAVKRCVDRQAAPALVTEEERIALFAHLASPTGVTETAATFGRREVIQQVVDWAGDRLGAAEICDLADAWLASEVVVRLDPDHRCEERAVVRRRDGRVISAVGPEPRYTTQAMLGVEERLFATYEAGRGAGAGVVPAATLDATLAGRPELGSDQVAMVRSVCASGHRIQCVLGPAGSGKTFALAAAARAWEDAGYRPLGAVVQGTATEVLRDATGMECSTVASLLYRLDHELLSLDERAVVVVDESSTLGNRDLARLASYVERTGAALRLVGDPAQHSAVAAGGAWRALLEHYPEDKAELVVRRRQGAPGMEAVRLASVDYAAGRISEAVERLRRDRRIVEADSPEELLDALVADWYVDRISRRADPGVPPSSMMADHHTERRELNARARALLVGDGTLHGPVLEVAGQSFQAGDEVVAMEQNRRLRPEGAGPGEFVRNGERGAVVEVRPGEHPEVVVDFERRGRVALGEDDLMRQIRPGVVGTIAHAYAVTSHMAQGETYQAGRHLSTDASSREGVYVGLTRGRGDARLYVVRRRELAPSLDAHAGLPRLDDEATTLQAVTRRLEAQQAERLATEVDPEAAEVARLRRDHDLAGLARLALASEDASASPAGRAYRHAADALASAACLDPDPALVARLGPRPEGGPQRRTWDRAVGAVAVYRTRWDIAPVPGGPGASWALGPAPEEGPALAYHRAAAEALEAAERSALAARPTAELATERRSLRHSLALAPSPDRLDEAAAAVELARRQLAAAEADHARAAQRLEGLSAARLWRRNRQGIEMARRSLHVADQRCARATVELERAEVQAAGLQEQAPAREALRQRLDAVEAALDIQVEAAVTSPASYLTAVLGEPPEDLTTPGSWREAAVRIETYRHAELGREPAEGPVVDEAGLVGAIGPRPEDYLGAVIWDHAADVAAPELAVELEPPGLDLGL
jgi:conjugative relaxase-like TrwC/TraI family protein